MYEKGLVAPIFSVALSRPANGQANDGYLSLGSSLPPVKTVGPWACHTIEYNVYVLGHTFSVGIC